MSDSAEVTLARSTDLHALAVRALRAVNEFRASYVPTAIEDNGAGWWQQATLEQLVEARVSIDGLRRLRALVVE